MEKIFGDDWMNVGKKWLAYFDILGFATMVTNEPPETVFPLYGQYLTEFKAQANRGKKLQFVHFSDTFLIYAPDDSKNSFSQIESASRWFMDHLIQRQIPLRGALSCDVFYADPSENIFIGKALVEACRCGEKFNWLGFILCRSAVSRMAEINLPADKRSEFRKWNVSFKDSRRIEPNAEEAWAYLIGGTRSLKNAQNVYVQALEQMRQRVTNEDVRAKYTNTLEFIKHCAANVS